MRAVAKSRIMTEHPPIRPGGPLADESRLLEPLLRTQRYRQEPREIRARRLEVLASLLRERRARDASVHVHDAERDAGTTLLRRRLEQRGREQAPHAQVGD